MNPLDTLRHQGLRKRLVEGLKIKGIKDEKVLNAISRVPRHLFMDSGFIQFAYKDQAFPIGAGQTISQPYTVAFQTCLLQLKPHDKVLEVGTGSGYQAAVLLEMGVNVFTIERQRELYLKVQQLLPQLGYFPKFFYGDGYKGLPTYGPFDKIIVTAGAPFIPEDLLQQLVIGGRLVIPLGPTDQQIMTVVTRVSEIEYKKETHGTFVFVPLLKGTEQ
ncbi:protein-L-isoaspartate(D-aspartate) O-methyltransferase [Mangrovibacterium marinum]|uniref:Protein-L-isoaspartate O-methyltransferase n=1 Tax=Mangrovibacterium marinum TaxID=1639118 RepID=A0A2T5C1C1_9BACT|nr:protein-L-isoaspartate(D-aspartate) O-methyltransferase [Mangrovibacterium marinum]PTN08389.1 protein-L-isoaspartate(D-aspartate) O-methyltransferase [Mangrovibacterium marinum]